VWISEGRATAAWQDAPGILAELDKFRCERGEVEQKLPNWILDLELGHRASGPLLRLARGLADLEKI